MVKIDFWKHTTLRKTFFIFNRRGRMQSYEFSDDEKRLMNNLRLAIKVGMDSEYVDSFEPSPRWYQLVEDFTNFHTVLYDDFFPEGMSLVEEFLNSKARQIAENAHSSPYIDHLFELVRVLIEFRYSIFNFIEQEDFLEVLSVGWLYGILDRAEFPKSTLVEEFGENVANTVELLIFTDEEKYRGASGFKDYLGRVLSNQTAAVVLLADRIANMRRTMRRYNHKDAYEYASQNDFIITEFKDKVPAGMLDEIEDLSIFLIQSLTELSAYREMLFRYLIKERFASDEQFNQWLDEREIPRDFWDWQPKEREF